MKKKASIVIILIMLSFVFSIQNIFAKTDNSISTSFTYTQNTLGDITISQDAYIPSGSYLDLNINNASDIFILNNIMYIADTDNSRVLKVSLNDKNVKVIGEGILKAPTGISADDKGNIYVADNSNLKAYIFSSDGKLETTFEKPTTPNFGENQIFKPIKIAPTGDGGAYIIGEGNTTGIIQMGSNGDFLGYFASNDVDMSVSQKIMNSFLTKDQKATFLKITPSTYLQVFRSDNGIIYTVNMGKDVSIKKHAIDGLEIVGNTDHEKYKLTDAKDIFVDKSGRIYSIENSGKIAVTNSSSDLICSFGGMLDKNEVTGLFKGASGIACDDDENIYVLDSVRNYIQVFTPTTNQKNIYKAIDNYNNGNYDISKQILEESLKLDNTSYIQHYFYGKNLLEQGDYLNASKEFLICNSVSLYSQCYWQIRNNWLQRNIGTVVIIVVVLYFIYAILKQVNKRSTIFKNFKKIKSTLSRKKLLRDLYLIKYGMFHPIDNAYDVKIRKTGTLFSGSILILILYIEFIASKRGKGFIFSTPVHDFSLFNTTLYFIIILFLFVIANYYISELLEGNGKMKDIFISIGYGFSPVIIFMPFIIIIANFSTLNETFLISGLTWFLICWSLINVIIYLMEIHEYGFKVLLKCLLLTFVTMAVIVLAVSIGYLLVIQVINFVHEIITEVIIHV